MSNSNKLLSRKAAAAALGIPARTVYALVRQGEIPAVRVGRVLRFDRAHLDEWLARRTANAPEPEPALIECAPLDLSDLDNRPLNTQLAAGLLAEQRRTNVLLTRLLNRRS